MKKITAILNCYNRSYTLKDQIKSLKEQTIPCDIIIWYNKSDNPQEIINEENIVTIISNKNYKFHGRFTPGLLVDTEYLAIFDDDILPGKKWFENCLNAMEINNGIMGASGITLSQKSYLPHAGKCGWNGLQVNSTTRVDLVGHAWFFRQDWLKFMWYEKPLTWNNGEDIMFSYLCQKYGKINTFVPGHPKDDKDRWGNISGKKWGIDQYASSRKKNHIETRDNICKYYIEHGWDTVKGIK